MFEGIFFSNTKRKDKLIMKKNAAAANDFEKTINSFSGKYSIKDIWSDWITVFAISLSQPLDYREEREENYLSITSKYSKDELSKFCELSAILINELEKNSDRDFLGETFMKFGLGNQRSGQFFTPYEISKCVSKMTCGNISEQIHQNGYVTINDCACGSGGMLIAAFNDIRDTLSKEAPSLNAQNHVHIAAQDIDSTVAMMCYVQLSLLGIAGIVKIGDAITEPMCGDLLDIPYSSDLWFTPMYNYSVWRGRRNIHRLMSLVKNLQSDDKGDSQK